MPVGEYPILEIVIKQLKAHGFEQITLAVGHLSELIRSYFGDGSRFGVKIDYSRESRPLGTMGPVSLIEGLDDTFLVMNGDVLTTLNYSSVVRFHRRNKAVATIATRERAIELGYGVIETDRGNRITNYIEKPTLNYRVSMGVYVFEPSVLRYVPKNRFMNVPDLVLRLLRKGERVMSYPTRAYWLDIGIPQEYEQAMRDFERDPKKFLPD